MSPIWMIIPSFHPIIGGAERQAQQLSRRLILDGWSVHVLTRRHRPAWSHELRAAEVVDGIPVIRLYSGGPVKFGSLLYVLGGWWYLLRHGRRGIYHAHDVRAPAWLAIAARYLLGGRCIVKLRSGRQAYEKLLSSNLMRWQFVALLRLVDRAIVMNREVEKLLHSLGIPAERVIRIPNAVDARQFYPASAEEKAAVRRRLGLPTGKTILLWVGRLRPVKGLNVLLRAWALLPAHKRDNALLILVGGGSERERLLGMVDWLGLRESVSLVGPQQAVRDYYWAADLFVLPSRSEGLSNALLEAMACGLPVVASNVGGALDMVEEGKNGLLFQTQDHNQLARKLATMMNMPNRWAEMGAQARETVLVYADLDVTIKRLHQLYQQLL